MSVLSKIGGKLGKGLKKVVTNPGKAVENIGRSIGGAVSTAAPALNLIPGVGPLAAAGLGSLGSVAAGNNMQQSLKTGLIGGGAGLLGAAGGLAKAIPGAANLPGVASIGGFLGKAKGVIQSIPGADKIGGIVKTVKGAARAANGGKAITLGSLGDALKGGVGAIASHPELAAAGLSAYSGYKDSKRATELENDSINTLRNAYLALNPNKPREDMTSLYADPGNPYNKAKKIRLQTA